MPFFRRLYIVTSKKPNELSQMYNADPHPLSTYIPLSHTRLALGQNGTRALSTDQPISSRRQDFSTQPALSERIGSQVTFDVVEPGTSLLQQKTLYIFSPRCLTSQIRYQNVEKRVSAVPLRLSFPLRVCWGEP